MTEEMNLSAELLQKQQAAEQRVRRMREENRRLAREMGACPPENRPSAPARRADSGRLLPLALAWLIYREKGPPELILALLYLAL